MPNVVNLDMDDLHTLMDTLDQDMDQVLESIALTLMGFAVGFAPVDTGALKNSIHVEKERILKYRVSDGVEYGIWQEIKGTPFMVPATERTGELVAGMVADSKVVE